MATKKTIKKAAAKSTKTAVAETKKAVTTAKSKVAAAKSNATSLKNKASSLQKKVANIDTTKLAKNAMETVIKKKGQSYECQICGKGSKTPIDAMTHLLDHGSSALEGVSNLIKEQREGRVAKTDKEATAAAKNGVNGKGKNGVKGSAAQEEDE